MRTFWSDEEVAIARRMRAERRKWSEIGAAIGRSDDAIRRKFRYEQIYGGLPKQQHQVEGLIVPDAVIEERERRRYLTPRDLTASFCGDPLPGYSALDRRRA